MSYKRGGATLNISIGKRKRTRTPITTKSTTNPCGNVPKETPSILCGDIKLTTTRDVSSPSKSSACCPKPIPKTDDDDEFKNDVSLELPSDIIIAIRSLKQNYSAATYNDSDQHSDHITFVLRTMVNFTLSTFSNDSKANQIASAMASTGFDVELKRLCSSGELRLIQLQGLNGEEDEAIFEMQDYWKVVSNVRMQQTVSSSDQRVIDLFLQCVKKFPQTFVLEQELLKEMARENRKSTSDKYVLQKEDAWINCLISQQLLLPRRLNTSISQSARECQSYWFTLPKLGYCASLIKEGRRRMINKLKRAAYKEVKRSSLEVSARGGMSGPFHVRDLLARGVAKVNNTANGQFIKLQREEY
jgi:Serine-threonine protein kinase 19.